ncbi:MAG: integration/recombination/inversion protein [Sphingomonas bacterium]|uniref:tyrosine-type recombinase/integrase n=1 Tax=Sphingomonas bacterium TaxID=1895847 RepID=UPI0026044B01|nr:integrase arm-type DNA-binding domain-containing protein [Sphingomonas bacterium]MDB5708247.1 integration/recombination/inversion protein [Sphingomonas bacterium]
MTINNKEMLSARMTVAQIDAVKPGVTRRMVSDELVRNLYLKIEPGGAKSWLYDAARLRGQGEGRIKLKLGSWPAMGLADARESARDRNEERDRGDDPRVLQVERAAAAKRAEADTVSAVFSDWILHKKLAKEGLKSLAEYERLIGKNVLPLYGDTPISKFTKLEVREAIKAMQRRGSASSANRLLVLLKQFLSWCSREDHVEYNVAADLVTTREEGTGSRELSIAELATLWRASDQLIDDERDSIRLLILTGARKMEALGAASAEYRNGLWMIPRDRSKNREPHVLPLGALGHPIFESRAKRKHLFAEFIYPSMMPDLAGNALAAMERLTGEFVEHWTLHSIRKGVRTALSSDEMDEMGEVFSENIAEIVLNHSLGALNRKYNKSKYKRQIGRALAAWERLLSQEIAKQTGGNVIQFAG